MTTTIDTGILQQNNLVDIKSKLNVMVANANPCKRNKTVTFHEWINNTFQTECTVY